MGSLISVIVPVYNVEKYIKKCIDLIINQTYQNLEIILVDDGSPDKCGEICEEYSKKDNRIKVIHKENGGVSDARNVGMEKATGEYIAFIDPDDYIENNMYELLIKEFELDNELDIVVCGINDINENGDVIKSSYNKNNIILDKKNFLKELLNEKILNCVIWNKLFKKDVIKGKLFNKNIKIAEDLDFLINIMENINKVKIIPNKLYYWLNRKSSATKAKFNNDCKKEIDICQNIIYLTNEKYKDIKNVAIKRYIRINISCYKKILVYDKDNENEKRYIRNNIKKYFWIYELKCNEIIKRKLIAVLIYLKII